jgi:ubiquinone/menaquinone biosynthesis C-methylase UbiE
MLDDQTKFELEAILACPNCRSSVKINGDKVECLSSKCTSSFPIVDGIPIMLAPKLADDLRLTEEKFSKEYESFHLSEQVDLEGDLQLRDAYHHVLKYSKYINDGYFLEVGSGTSKISYLLAQKGVKTVGVDLSLSALKIGKALFEKANLHGLFVCGDICSLPFKTNTFSLMYGGGVIEHFKETKKAVDELYRCLTINGLITTTVPCISLSTLYRILRWGNIPDVYPLDVIVETIEIKLLKEKFMRFGYEKSFNPKKIEKIFKASGFSEIEIGLFKTYYPLEIVKIESVKKAITYIANTRPFWPMIYINGSKQHE